MTLLPLFAADRYHVETAPSDRGDGRLDVALYDSTRLAQRLCASDGVHPDRAAQVVGDMARICDLRSGPNDPVSIAARIAVEAERLRGLHADGSTINQAFNGDYGSVLGHLTAAIDAIRAIFEDTGQALAEYETQFEDPEGVWSHAGAHTTTVAHHLASALPLSACASEHAVEAAKIDAAKGRRLTP